MVWTMSMFRWPKHYYQDTRLTAPQFFVCEAEHLASDLLAVQYYVLDTLLQPFMVSKQASTHLLSPSQPTKVFCTETASL